jgi:hypothetical protein
LPDAHHWNLQPIVDGPAHNHSRRRKWSAVIDAFRRFNDAGISLPIRYIEFDTADKDGLVFAELEY